MTGPRETTLWISLALWISSADLFELAGGASFVWPRALICMWWFHSLWVTTRCWSWVIRKGNNRCCCSLWQAMRDQPLPILCTLSIGYGGSDFTCVPGVIKTRLPRADRVLGNAPVHPEVVIVCGITISTSPAMQLGSLAYGVARNNFPLLFFFPFYL